MCIVCLVIILNSVLFGGVLLMNLGFLLYFLFKLVVCIRNCNMKNRIYNKKIKCFVLLYGEFVFVLNLYNLFGDWLMLLGY